MKMSKLMTKNNKLLTNGLSKQLKPVTKSMQRFVKLVEEIHIQAL